MSDQGEKTVRIEYIHTSYFDKKFDLIAEREKELLKEIGERDKKLQNDIDEIKTHLLKDNETESEDTESYYDIELSERRAALKERVSKTKKWDGLMTEVFRAKYGISIETRIKRPKRSKYDKYYKEYGPQNFDFCK